MGRIAAEFDPERYEAIVNAVEAQLARRHVDGERCGGLLQSRSPEARGWVAGLGRGIAAHQRDGLIP